MCVISSSSCWCFQTYSCRTSLELRSACVRYQLQKPRRRIPSPHCAGENGTHMRAFFCSSVGFLVLARSFGRLVLCSADIPTPPLVNSGYYPMSKLGMWRLGNLLRVFRTSNSWCRQTPSYRTSLGHRSAHTRRQLRNAKTGDTKFPLRTLLTSSTYVNVFLTLSWASGADSSFVSLVLCSANILTSPLVEFTPIPAGARNAGVGDSLGGCE